MSVPIFLWYINVLWYTGILIVLMLFAGINFMLDIDTDMTKYLLFNFIPVHCSALDQT